MYLPGARQLLIAFLRTCMFMKRHSPLVSRTLKSLNNYMISVSTIFLCRVNYRLSTHSSLQAVVRRVKLEKSKHLHQSASPIAVRPAYSASWNHAVETYTATAGKCLLQNVGTPLHTICLCVAANHSVWQWVEQELVMLPMQTTNTL